MNTKYFLLLLLPFFFYSVAFSTSNSIYKINISGTIDNGLAPYVERAIKEAEADSANYILFEINTFGGRVDAATTIKDHIINTKIPTVAYVNKRAISAGSLIALSCHKLIMAEGSSMGATTVVNQKGEKQSEKAQSFMRAEMGSAAESNHRRKDIAQAMVDEDIEIINLTEKGKLLTLTAKDAKEFGMCDTVLSNYQEIYQYLQMKDPIIIEVSVSAAENIVRFLTNPVISSLLMSLGFLGLIFEIKTPGWGVGGTVGIVALGLFFGSHYIINMADHVEIVIFLAGLTMLMLEIFVIPGFGIAGILGITGILLSMYMTMVGRFPTGDDLISAGATLSSAFILTVIGIYIMIKKLPEMELFDFLVVKNRHASGSAVKSSLKDQQLVGLTGTATTDLRLAGKIKIGQKEYQAISKDEYIQRGETIIVEKVQGNKIVVIKRNETQETK